MLLPRRISEKKCRFTAKKITFLEYQRVKRLELTKNITERKRLGSILFLPEAVEQSNSLTHESIQRILHQGSLFHSVKTNSNSLDNYFDSTNEVSNHFDTLCNIRDNNLKDSIKGSLNDLLYGRILNVRCLNNHDLCILLSYLINVSEFSEVKCSLLLKVLEQINLKFNTLSISEISHTLYNIIQLNKLTDKYKIFMDLSSAIVGRTTRLLFNGNTKLNPINFISSSNVSKIIYTLTHWDILDLKLDLKQLLKLYLKYLDSNKPNSREFSLICKSMTKLKSPDYEILKVFSDYYYHQIHQFNLNMNNSTNKRERREDQFDVNNKISNNLNMLYCFDKMGEKMEMNDLFVLLETNEYFGINHSNLLNEFDRYISIYLCIFTSNTRILVNMYNRGNSNNGGGNKNVVGLGKSNNYNAISNTNNTAVNNNTNDNNSNTKGGYMSSRKKKMLINLLKNDNYLKNNKLNLQKIYSEICRLGGNNEHLWNLEVIKKIKKNVNKRHLFKKYVMAIGMGDNEDNIGHSSDIAGDREFDVNHKINNSKDGNNYTNSSSMDGSSGHDLIRGFMEAIEYLPKVINFNNIWKVFKIINDSSRIDLVPMFYSYISESSIVFEDLEEPSDDLYGIFKQIMENKSENYLVEVDNICKIVEIFCDCDLRRDYIGIKMFCNMFNILVLINSMYVDVADNKLNELDKLNKLNVLNELNSCGSLDSIKEKLEEYFEKYLKVKVLNFENIPNRNNSNKMFRFIPKMEECKNIDDMMLVLEEFRRLDEKLSKIVDSNIDVFKFVIYNGLLNKMKEEGFKM